MLDIHSRLTLNDGRRIPLLGFGVWKTPGGKECEEAVLTALEAGYRHIDTAAIYGNENSVGSALRKSGIPREQIFITTKLWNEDHADPVRAMSESLRRLQLDYTDLYLIHFPVAARNESWRTLEKLKKSERAKSIGVSNFTIRHLEQLLRISSITPAVNQVEMHPFLYQKELIAFCRSAGIEIEAYSPLTHGKRLGDPKLRRVADRYSRSPAQILIRWALQHGMVTLPKSVHRARILENAAVFDFEISPEDMELMDGFNENLRTCWDPTNVP